MWEDAQLRDHVPLLQKGHCVLMYKMEAKERCFIATVDGQTLLEACSNRNRVSKQASPAKKQRAIDPKSIDSVQVWLHPSKQTMEVKFFCGDNIWSIIFDIEADYTLHYVGDRMWEFKFQEFLDGTSENVPMCTERDGLS